MVHGSGPQDRDGYASIIAVVADALASSGRIVLTYDKRGSGASAGDGNRAGFATLAADARAAMAYLAGRSEVDQRRIGLAGSSQAGWVVAKAIADGAEPHDVWLLGAAGTAFTVREQNLYNTEVRMACAGLSPDRQRVALDQQAGFFDALADRTKAARLDELTRAARADPGLADWLFPGSEGLATPGAWYTTLDPAFDPLPVWAAYGGPMTFVFGEFDDATDTAGAIERLKGTPPRVVFLKGAQHLGLRATSRCDGDFGALEGFAPEMFKSLELFAKG